MSDCLWIFIKSHSSVFKITMWFIFIFVLLICDIALADKPPKLEEFIPKRSQELDTKLSIFCSVQQGTKPYKFEWYRNGQILSTSDSRYRIETSIDNSVLTIPNLSILDSSSNFSCSVRNHVGHDTKSTILIVKGMNL